MQTTSIAMLVAMPLQLPDIPIQISMESEPEDSTGGIAITASADATSSLPLESEPQAQLLLARAFRMDYFCMLLPPAAVEAALALCSMKGSEDAAVPSAVVHSLWLSSGTAQPADLYQLSLSSTGH